MGTNSRSAAFVAKGTGGGGGNYFDSSDDWNDKHPFVWRSILGWAARAILGASVVLYALNQAHLLNRPMTSFVSKWLFWPTLPITASKRIGEWVTTIDDTLMIGGAPIGFLKYPERLRFEYNIEGVVNFCEEYAGPVKKYIKLGMEQLYLPTTDHFEPSVADLEAAVQFIERHRKENMRVYVHCRAGHGRSGAAALAWLMYKHPEVSPRKLNSELFMIRKVRTKLWNQTNIKELHAKWEKENEIA